MRLSVAPAGASLRFVVDDDGPGVPADQREIVFERFHPTDPSRARSSGGTGLGLAIVREIVLAHGGAVRVGEAAGGGARVELEIPGWRPAAQRPPGRGA